MKEHKRTLLLRMDLKKEEEMKSTAGLRMDTDVSLISPLIGAEIESKVALSSRVE